jgi:hypothetical protein
MSVPEGIALLVAKTPKLQLEESREIAQKYYGLDIKECKNLSSGMFEAHFLLMNI